MTAVAATAVAIRRVAASRRVATALAATAVIGLLGLVALAGNPAREVASSGR